MLFVKSDRLKVGMRLARPIYNKNGVLLYERNSKLTPQGIVSINNFGLIGIYILEPAEPVPPMTQDDIEFERFQTMCVFAIGEVLMGLIENKKAPKMYTLASGIIKSYGKLDRKINFIQNLRSNEDYIFKHTLNVSILCALMAHKLKVKADEQFDVVTAAIVHEIGKLAYQKSIKQPNLTPEEEAKRIKRAEIAGFDMIADVLSNSTSLKRICLQSQRMLDDFAEGITESTVKPSIGTKIMMVAEVFDSMTAMHNENEPSSEVSAVRYLLENNQVFDKEVVRALIDSIHLLSPGTCIELNTGEKGLVLNDNDVDFLMPYILLFTNNKVVDLADRKNYKDLEIKDIMKTLDNRHVMDTELLKQHGYAVAEQENVKESDIVAPEYVDELRDVASEIKSTVGTDGGTDSDLEEEYVPGRDF